MIENESSKKRNYKDFLKSFLIRIKEIILSPFRLFKAICFSIGFFVIIIFISMIVMSYSFYKSLPNIKSMDFKKIKFASINKTKNRIKPKNLKSKYFWKPIHKINRELIYSVVMSEDSTFFEHNGVNFNAMIDSLGRNIRKRSYDSGASTITQQVVKNIFLTNEKTIIRKLKEIIIARMLESKYTKNQILEIYLNIAELGPNIYGFPMAAQHFFKIKTENINAAQGAYMSLMLPSPRRNYFSIYQNNYLSKKNRKKIYRVLRDMKYLEYLSPLQYKKYKSLTFLKNLKK